MPLGSAALVSPLFDLFTLQVDPTWAYYNHWIDDIGNGTGLIAATFFDFEEGITESAAVQYSDAEIMGRPESIKVFQGVNSREVSLLLPFRVQGIALTVNDQNATDIQGAITREVYNPAQFIEACQNPYIAADGLTRAPPPLILSIGSHLYMRCLITSCQLHYVGPVDPTTLLHHGCDVQVTFTAAAAQLGNYQFGRYRNQLNPPPSASATSSADQSFGGSATP